MNWYVGCDTFENEKIRAAGHPRHDCAQISRPGVAGGGVGGAPGHGAGPSRHRVDSGNDLPRGGLRVRPGRRDVDRGEPGPDRLSVGFRAAAPRRERVRKRMNWWR